MVEHIVLCYFKHCANSILFHNFDLCVFHPERFVGRGAQLPLLGRSVEKHIGNDVHFGMLY